MPILNEVPGNRETRQSVLSKVVHKLYIRLLFSSSRYYFDFYGASDLMIF